MHAARACNRTFCDKMYRVALLSIFFIFSSLVAEEEGNPFSPTLYWKPEEKTKFSTLGFTMDAIHQLPPGLPEDYNPADEYFEGMKKREMSLLRYLQKNGIDFLGADGSPINK